MSSTEIHPTAIVHEGAQLGAGVKVGAYSIIGPELKIGDGTEVMPHVFLDGNTQIGAGCTIYPFASIGTRTQDLKFHGGKPGVIIGERTTLREYVTVNAATYDGDYTRVGSDCLIMAYAHVAHDCIVGNEVVIANACALAGHLVIEDQVIIGGLSGIHQFVRLGRMCIIGGCSKVTQDVPPFMMADGHPLQVRSINSVGLKRRGVSEEAQRLIKQAFRILYRKQLITHQAIEQIEKDIEQIPEVIQLLQFVKSSERGITR